MRKTVIVLLKTRTTYPMRFHPRFCLCGVSVTPLFSSLCFVKIELGLDISQGNIAYTATTLSKEVLSSIGLSMRDEEYDFPSLYWIPQFHKCSYKQRYIA